MNKKLLELEESLDLNKSDEELLAELNALDKRDILTELINTNEKYLISTTYFTSSADGNKYFIKGNNRVGLLFMKLRNQLNDTLQKEIIAPVEIVSYDDIYSNVPVTGGPALVYSEFNNGEGINIFSKVLDYNGYSLFNPDDFGNDPGSIDENDFAPRYAVITGNVDMQRRQDIINFFNNSLNKHGQFIHIILGTSAASEGISLFYIRQVHILEPFWHNVKLNQVIGRARRLKSHKLLPVDEREVYIYKYISHSSTSVSTDEYLYTLAENNSLMIEDVHSLMRGAAIDCSLNSAQNGDIKCFKFPINKKGAAFKLDSDKTEDNVKIVDKITEDKKLFILKDNMGKAVGAYLITSNGNAAEKKLYYVNNNYPDLEYAGKKLMMFPIYNAVQAEKGIFVIECFACILPNKKLKRFAPQYII
jgi:hypothetical protein